MWLYQRLLHCPIAFGNIPHSFRLWFRAFAAFPPPLYAHARTRTRVFIARVLSHTHAHALLLLVTVLFVYYNTRIRTHVYVRFPGFWAFHSFWLWLSPLLCLKSMAFARLLLCFCFFVRAKHVFPIAFGNFMPIAYVFPIAFGYGLARDIAFGYEKWRAGWFIRCKNNIFKKKIRCKNNILREEIR